MASELPPSVSPLLQDWLAEEVRKRSAVAKEIRKAREERELLKPAPKGKQKKQNNNNDGPTDDGR